MRPTRIAHWQRDFFAGLAVILPVVISIAIVLWLFKAVSRNFTDTLLFFLPQTWTHSDAGAGPIYWYWSLVALLWAVLLITLTGTMARHYIVRKIIAYFEWVLLRVPLLNKIYSTIKQVNASFSSSSKSAFRQVVLVQFPRQGQYSVGFVTGDQNEEAQVRIKERIISVFVPTTPNPTSGFLILVPEHELTYMQMSVADGIRFIVSLGTVAPTYQPVLPPGIDAKSVTVPPVADASSSPSTTARAQN